MAESVFPLTLYLVMTEDDAHFFEALKCIDRTYFGQTRGKSHITFHEQIQDAVLEACTVPCKEVVEALYKDTQWYFLVIHLSQGEYADRHYRGDFERWSMRKKSWRFWVDIDLKTASHSWGTITTSKMPLWQWSAKMLFMYQEVGEGVCSSCTGSCSKLWKGTHDDKDNAFCAHCWYTHFQMNHINNTGRVDYKRKRPDAGSDLYAKRSKVET